MKFSVILLFILGPPKGFAFVPGSRTIPNQLTVMTQADLIRISNEPGLLSYDYEIEGNSTSIVLYELEGMARLAERTGYDMSVRFETSQGGNITISLEKCGLLSSPLSIMIQNEVLIVSPSYFNILTNIGLACCKEVETTMLMHIYGDTGTSGNVSVNILEYDINGNALVHQTLVRLFYPVTFIFIVILFSCAYPSKFCCFTEPIIVKCGGYKTWMDCPRIAYSRKGASV
ncbi:hypothetical protein L5515_019591 [Caenorhabditis briggsae]|uniref:Uncharacterized protein n=1 Tax=Caenorhabditis briggsae TaxID=6238 RepID=A0AAE9JTZ1_CAEBR|nr:hypothetical protein L5515_019591 [Caenorhabditis briggsae]